MFALLVFLSCNGTLKDSTGETTTPPTTTEPTTDSATTPSCDDASDTTGDFAPTGGAPYRKVSIGETVVCAIRTDKSLECWAASDAPDTLVPPAGTFVDIDIALRGCAIDTTGYPVCWGDNATFISEVPDVPLTGLVSGHEFACGIDADQHAVCWGDLTEPFEDTYTQLCANVRYACGLTTSGRMECRHSIAVSSEVADATNAALAGVVGDYTAVACNEKSVCASTEDGRWTCWGNDDGYGFPPDDIEILQLEGSVPGYCGILADQTVACWGADYADPVPCGTFSQISVFGGLFACGIRTSGAIACWGSRF